MGHKSSTSGPRPLMLADRARAGEQLRQPSQTQYVGMLLDLDTIPRMYNIFAALFAWLMLAGFVTLPGTFTSLGGSLGRQPGIADSDVAEAVLHSVGNVPLLVVGATCCGLGAAGLVWLSVKWRRNYVWLLNKLYLPALLNALTGLISTLVGVYTAHDGEWSITAKTIAIIEGCCAGVSLLLFLLYNFVFLERVKKRHGKEMGTWNGSQRGHESIKDRIERSKKRPGLGPESVV